MARIIANPEEKSKNIKAIDIENLENQDTKETFEKLGIQFDCRTGTCGTCRIQILEGMENINPKTDMENYFPMEDDERLACQCTKIKGDIKIENAEW